MKRLQLFEFEDFSWFPSIWRSTMTKMIIILQKALKADEVILKLIVDVKKKFEFDQITDLGSGAGGALNLAVKAYNEQHKQAVKLLMSDLHPNKQFVNQINSEGDHNIEYIATSVDAAHLENAPKGLKTMMNSFHHMPPTVAQNILQSAQDNKQPLLVYEIGENKFPFLLWVLLLPITLPITGLTSILFMPFVRPFKWYDLAFTLIPIVPLFYAWDGQASLPRTYTTEDIESMLPAESANYTWQIERASHPNGKKIGYYILGLPNSR